MLNTSKQLLFHWLLVLVTIFFTFFILMAVTYVVYENIYYNKIYPGTYLGQINLGGRTPEQVRQIINQKLDAIYQSGITFYYDSYYTTILPTIASTETDLSYDIINFDVENTVNQAYFLGRQCNFWDNLKNKIDMLIHGYHIQLRMSINNEEIKGIFSKSFAKYEVPARNAQLVFSDGAFAINEEALGMAINFDKAINDLQHNLRILNDSSITLVTTPDYPVIYKKDCINLKGEAEDIIILAPATLTYKNKKWIASKNQLAEWLSLKVLPTQSEDCRAKVGLNFEEVSDFFKEEIVPKINYQFIDAKFKIEDGRVIEFQTDQDGLEIDIDTTIANLETILLKGSSTIEIITTVLPSKIKTQNVNSLGIKEIIGTGHSNFTGSPNNRRHNIKVGGNSLHGVLVKPDEEFSLNKALGKIDDSTGYKPELVIKGNETIPEYGGGLCQIGTTMFRAALYSGLSITMRRNHSYRVSYYEPAGTDATIYNPWPDLRFINDTGRHILIQTRINEDDLYFDFWGTKDGRVVKKTEPVISDIVKPGPTKYIETLDLPVGEKKCTEHAHNGADAYFDYTVTYSDGEVKEKRFKSHYVPWRAVCLIGVEELTSEIDEGSATSTKEVIE